ncbi:NAF1-domain-containing protein [Leucogyrophana mollusca]|uniref:NAF1-domain-containing protein n=1 Tax=Leucogyrophana mollusca TaxID=85980 RepID=A0ACB8BYA1_9AGAM|nr:NAF1-domain-containing protein [Leucogyrophana mollusca]
MDFQFKVPENIPQDILLIQDLVGVVTPVKQDHRKDVHIESSDDSIDSSGSDGDSEDEVEANLLITPDEKATASPPLPALSDSTSDSDSDADSDSDSDSSSDIQQDVGAVSHPPKTQFDMDDDEESGPAPATYVQTKNEVVDADIIVPSISEVGPDEVIEKVGEVMSIVGNVVIVKGVASDLIKLASERALDAETLLVFDDRKVLGHIYETFGPTSQPMYQVKFNQKYPLDTEKVRVSREVYHLPQRSNFVFVDHLKKLRGSDASNLHDEEPAEDELEFSDDEQEAAFKSRKKRRGQSVSSSRQTTPGPSQPHYDDMNDAAFYGANPYDAHGPYDEDFRAPGPSRPPPVPYDDPYAEEFKSDILNYEDGPSQSPAQSPSQTAGAPAPQHNYDFEGRFAGGRGRGRGRGRGDVRPSRERGGRGRGGRGRGDRSRRPGGWTSQDNPSPAERRESPQIPRSLSPTSLAIERATGQFAGGMAGYQPMQQAASSSWAYVPQGDTQAQSYQQQQQYVQPHINPRFASAFGFNMNVGPAQWYGYDYGQPHEAPSSNGYQGSDPQRDWTEEWTVHGHPSGDNGGAHYPPG